jgi:hypothetical protein
MSGNDDLERDIREEDEMRRLLRATERASVPAFSSVAARAKRGSTPSRTLAAVAAAVLVIVAGIALFRPGTTPAAAPSISPSASGSSFETSCVIQTSGLQTHVIGSSLAASLVSVRPTDQQTNQLWWTVRYFNFGKSPATVSVQAQITASGRSFMQILGYQLTEPSARTLTDGEPLTIERCQWATFVIRTGGPLLDGTFPYEITIEKVGLPEGGTVADRFALTLACSSRSVTCDPVAANATASPTVTPDAALLRSSFGVIYSGVRQGWDKGSAPLVRREGEADRAVGELAPSYFNQFGGSVSPDGRRAAYFAQRQGEPWAVYMLGGAKPNEQRKLLEIRGEIPGGGPLWSGDGAGLAFTAQDEASGQGVTPKYSAIRTFDLATGAVAEVARLTDGSSYNVLGWNRASRTLAAVVTPHAAPAGGYVVFAPSGTRRAALDPGWNMLGSPDGLIVAGTLCEGPSRGCSLWTWPLEDFGARVDRHAGTGVSLGLYAWRPGSSEVAFVIGSITGGLYRIDTSSASGGQRTLHRFASGESPSSSPFFRADGTALFIWSGTRAVVVDVASGASTTLPMPVTTVPYEVGRPLASIRLD